MVLDLPKQATRDMCDALQNLGVNAKVKANGRLSVAVRGGSPTEFNPLERSVLSAGRAADVARSVAGSTSPVVVVADKIPVPARDELTAADVSWFDRRGHVRLVAPGLLIDADVTAKIKAPAPLRFPSGRTGVGVALALLNRPENPPSGAEIADLAGVAMSGVSATLRTFRDLGLINHDGTPVIPDLFWATAEQWHTTWVPVSALVDSDDLLMKRGEANFGDLDQSGWCLAGDSAASAWDAPVIGGDVGARHWYVPSEGVVNHLRWVLGEPGAREPAADWIAVAPTPAVCRLRARTPHRVEPVEPLVAAALDLALDRARGTESLDQWNPESHVRVW